MWGYPNVDGACVGFPRGQWLESVGFRVSLEARKHRPGADGLTVKETSCCPEAVGEGGSTESDAGGVEGGEQMDFVLRSGRQSLRRGVRKERGQRPKGVAALREVTRKGRSQRSTPAVR